jgi:hypothetical protein
MSLIFDAAAKYAAIGWNIIRVSGIRADGTCACYLGAECSTPGKHPLDRNWQERGTTNEDEIASWFLNGSEPNIGLVFGAKSGVVDTEWDNADAKAVAEKYGLTKIATPTYESSRGQHRLWKFDSRLPRKAVAKLGGLEVRIGGDKRGAQSLLPPSRHSSGTVYKWLPGLSPDEVELASLPEPFMAALIEAEGGGGDNELSIRRNVPAMSIVQSGLEITERHTGMVRLISSEIMRMRDPHDPSEQQVVMTILHALNQTICRPPLPDAELKSIWQGQLRWGMKARAAGVYDVASTDEKANEIVDTKMKENPHALNGLEFRDGEWWPGKWKLAVVMSDPCEYRLAVPTNLKLGLDRKPLPIEDEEDLIYTFVSLSSSDWTQPVTVARKILEATATIDVTDPNPKEWAKIWNGYSMRPKKVKKKKIDSDGEDIVEASTKKCPPVRGLKVKLMDQRTEEIPPPEQQRYVLLAGWLLDALTNTGFPDGTNPDDDKPHASGKPSWVRQKDGRFDLYFSWNRVFEDIRKSRKVNVLDGEMVSLKRRILIATGDSEFYAKRARSENGTQRRYIVWEQRHIDALETIAHPVEATA